MRERESENEYKRDKRQGRTREARDLHQIVCCRSSFRTHPDRPSKPRPRSVQQQQSGHGQYSSNNQVTVNTAANNQVTVNTAATIKSRSIQQPTIRSRSIHQPVVIKQPAIICQLWVGALGGEVVDLASPAPLNVTEAVTAGLSFNFCCHQV